MLRLSLSDETRKLTRRVVFNSSTSRMSKKGFHVFFCIFLYHIITVWRQETVRERERYGMQQKLSDRIQPGTLQSAWCASQTCRQQGHATPFHSQDVLPCLSARCGYLHQYYRFKGLVIVFILHTEHYHCCYFNCLVPLFFI